MKAERPLRVVFFKTDTGNEPVREWLKDLPKEDCKVIGADIAGLLETSSTGAVSLVLAT